MSRFGSLKQRLGQRLGWGGDLATSSLVTTDRVVMARSLMYLLLGVSTAVVASVGIPDAPLENETAVPVLAGVAYAASIGVFFGFDKLPKWGFHVLLLAVTALV